MERITFTSTTILALSVATAALAQSSNIAANDKTAWGENIGFTNWADANNRVDGVRFEGTHLLGFIWGENVGWINTGSGPMNGVSYANDATADKGVNVDGNGDLFGYAWGENIGWVNFDTRTSLTPFGQQARYDASAKHFRGYAWGENVGWINLDSAGVFVGVCFADITTTGSSSGVSDGVVDLSDFSFYLSLWSTGDPAADLTTTGVCNPGFGGDGVDLSDFSCYLSEWSQGCPCRVHASRDPAHGRTTAPVKQAVRLGVRSQAGPTPWDAACRKTRGVSFNDSMG